MSDEPTDVEVLSALDKEAAEAEMRPGPLTAGPPMRMIDSAYHQLAPGEIMLRPEEPGPYAGAGMTKLPEEKANILTAPFKPEEIDILPTGELYITQVRYRSRLTKAFGPGGWCLVPMSDIKTSKKGSGLNLMREFHLTAHGRFLSQAFGSQNYYENNADMDYASALDGMKSDALKRCCKDLSIGAECWDAAWAEQFRREYCVKVEVPERAGSQNYKPAWRKKDRNPFKNERPFRP